MSKIINRKSKVIYRVEFDDYVEFKVNIEGLIIDNIDNIKEQVGNQFYDVLKKEFEKNDIILESVKLIRFVEYLLPKVEEESYTVKAKTLELELIIDPQNKEVEIDNMTIKQEDLITHGVTAVIVLGLITATALFGWLTVREIKLTVQEVKNLEPDQLAFLESIMTKGSISFLIVGFIFWLIWKWFKGGDKD